MLDKAMPLSDVVARLAECAARRQPWAIKLWLAYRWGEPVQRAEVSGPDGEALIINIVRQDDPALPGTA